jgi:hypothetical protein
LTDTRPGQAVGPRTAPLGADETITVTASGANGECTGASAIPADAVSLSLNVTATGPTTSTFLTFWGDGEDPGTSNLNPAPGQPPTPNAVLTPLSDSGSFNVRNNRGSVNIIVDVNGYYVPHDHDDRYPLITDLDDYATLTDLDDYATVTDLDDYATLTDLDDYAALDDLPFMAGGAVEVVAPNATITTLNAPTGVSATVTREGVGDYTVELTGLTAAIDGVAQVTGFTNPILGVHACSLGAAAATTSTFTLSIQCIGRDMNPSTDVIPSDTSFHFLVTG